jgi:hypothetical protein
MYNFRAQAKISKVVTNGRARQHCAIAHKTLIVLVGRAREIGRAISATGG